MQVFKGTIFCCVTSLEEMLQYLLFFITEVLFIQRHIPHLKYPGAVKIVPHILLKTCQDFKFKTKLYLVYIFIMLLCSNMTSHNYYCQ